jgi:hypothetical protein
MNITYEAYFVPYRPYRDNPDYIREYHSEIEVRTARGQILRFRKTILRPEYDAVKASGNLDLLAAFHRDECHRSIRRAIEDAMAERRT